MDMSADDPRHQVAEVIHLLESVGSRALAPEVLRGQGAVQLLRVLLGLLEAWLYAAPRSLELRLLLAQVIRGTPVKDYLAESRDSVVSRLLTRRSSHEPDLDSSCGWLAELARNAGWALEQQSLGQLAQAAFQALGPQQQARLLQQKHAATASAYGPAEGNTFLWAGHAHRVPPAVWRTLSALWVDCIGYDEAGSPCEACGRETAQLAQALGVEDASVRKYVKRANTWLQVQQGLPLTIESTGALSWGLRIAP